MDTIEEFHESCRQFHKKYMVAKKDLSAIEQLGPLLIKPIENEIEAIGTTACRSGCNHCCYLKVVALPHEIISIYFFLNRVLAKEQLREIRNKITSQYEIIQPLSEDEHFTTNIQCPLLLNGCCLVYPVRPISCAGYHSISEVKCRESNEHPEITGKENGGIPVIRSIKDKQVMQNTVATRVIMEMQDDEEWYELVRALHHLFKKPSLIQRWRDGRKVFKSM